MGAKQLALIVVLVNLIIFGIMALLSLQAPDVMTTGRILTYLGFVLNIILLIVVVIGKPKL